MNDGIELTDADFAPMTAERVIMIVGQRLKMTGHAQSFNHGELIAEQVLKSLKNMEII